MPTGPLPHAPRSILIVMLSAVGDAIQVLPVVMALRRTFPTTHISWVIQPGPHSLVDGHQAVDEFVLFHRERRSRKSLSFVAGARHLLEAATALRESARRQPGGRFDLLLQVLVDA